MSTESTISLPSCIRGMKVLDRDAFTGRVTAVGLKVPVYSIEAVRKHYKHWLLKVPKLHATRDLPDSDPDRHTHRLLLLSPNFIKPSESFGEGGQTFLTENGVDLTDIQQHDFKLTYENFTYDDVLDAVLPSGMSVGGFSVIGHIAHLNLKDTLLEYKYIIGSVILSSVFLFTLFFFPVLTSAALSLLILAVRKGLHLMHWSNGLCRTPNPNPLVC